MLDIVLISDYTHGNLLLLHFHIINLASIDEWCCSYTLPYLFQKGPTIRSWSAHCKVCFVVDIWSSRWCSFHAASFVHADTYCIMWPRAYQREWCTRTHNVMLRYALCFTCFERRTIKIARKYNIWIFNLYLCNRSSTYWTHFLCSGIEINL